MRSRPPLIAILMLFSSFALGSLAACGHRPLATTDAAEPPGDGLSPPADGSPGKDGACVRPPGGCFGPQDCPASQDCKGCYPDPCCPMCAVCYGKCVSSGECWSDKDCASGSFCNLDGGDCGKTKPGLCSPVPQVYADGGYSPVCGCDGKTYMAACDAHAVKVSVASVGPCDQQGCTALDEAYATALDQARTCSE